MEVIGLQALFNIAVMAFGALFVWVLKTSWDALKELQQEDKDLADRVAAIQVLVVGDYVKRNELDGKFNYACAQLEKLNNKLDTKVDK